MAGPSLDDPLDKLRWAKRHFEVLRCQIEPFEQRDAHTISCDVDRDAGKYVFRVHGLEPVDPDWGLMIGDCIHNARTALDYLMVRLYAIATGQEVRTIRRVSFPIYTHTNIAHAELGTPASFLAADADDAARSDFASATAKYRKHPAFSGYLATIEQLQPFNQGNVSIWGAANPNGSMRRIHPLPIALEYLSTLDNLDKHRLIHAAWIGVVPGPDWDGPPRPPDNFRQLNAVINSKPLEDGAPVDTITFETPLPGEWQPSEVDMKRAFPLRVAFAEPAALNRVLEVLGQCLWGVEAVLEIFRPVFEGFQPPLPVTAIEVPS